MDIPLMKDEIVSFTGSFTGVTVRCDAGMIWVTMAGDKRDHILTEGEELPIAWRKKVVIVAQKESLVRFYRPVRVDTVKKTIWKTRLHQGEKRQLNGVWSRSFIRDVV